MICMDASLPSKMSIPKVKIPTTKNASVAQSNNANLIPLLCARMMRNENRVRPSQTRAVKSHGVTVRKEFT